MIESHAIAALIEARNALTETVSRSQVRVNEAYAEVGRHSERIRECRGGIEDIDNTLRLLRGES